MSPSSPSNGVPNLKKNYFKVVPVSNITTPFGLERDFSPVRTYFSLYIEFCSNEYKNQTLLFYSSIFY